MSKIDSFQDVNCWKKSREVRLFVMQLVKKFPNDEKYALISQIRRASRSAGNNIAEGYGRFHHQENIQFCRIARGSLYETIDHLLVAGEEGYISKEEYFEGRNLILSAVTILNGYINYLKKAKKG
jgi:four helix bundle protein